LPDGALAYQLGLASDRVDERSQPLGGELLTRRPSPGEGAERAERSHPLDGVLRLTGAGPVARFRLSHPLGGDFASRAAGAYGDAPLPGEPDRPCPDRPYLDRPYPYEEKFSFEARPPASRGRAVGEPAPFVLAKDRERASESRSLGSRRARDGPRWTGPLPASRRCGAAPADASLKTAASRPAAANSGLGTCVLAGRPATSDASQSMTGLSSRS